MYICNVWYKPTGGMAMVAAEDEENLNYKVRTLIAGNRWHPNDCILDKHEGRKKNGTP